MVVERDLISAGIILESMLYQQHEYGFPPSTCCPLLVIFDAGPGVEELARLKGGQNTCGHG